MFSTPQAVIVVVRREQLLPSSCERTKGGPVSAVAALTLNQRLNP
jgi:hypothetical protein